MHRTGFEGDGRMPIPPTSSRTPHADPVDDYPVTEIDAQSLVLFEPLFVVLNRGERVLNIVFAVGFRQTRISRLLGRPSAKPSGRTSHQRSTQPEIASALRKISRGWDHEPVRFARLPAAAESRRREERGVRM
jgi:hypothetical protein